MDAYSCVLANYQDLSPITTPLKSTQRIKYTCFNVSQNFLVMGASSGGLYVFRRDPCSFIQLLPNQEGSVTHVAISPDEKLFAFASVKGVVCILEKNGSGLGARRIFTSSEHVGATVTALQWNGQCNELFIGDQSGKISIISLLPFMMKNMFNPPSCTLMVLDSQIVQLDWQSDLLLVSTLTRSYICDIARERYRQIGMKLRDGEYGACFYVTRDLPLKMQVRTEAVGGNFMLMNDSEPLRECEDFQYVKAFCARPGSRLWEVHVDGTVLNTHQFKQALAIAPTAVIRVPHSYDSSQQADKCIDTNNAEGDMIWNQQSFNFCKLFILAKRYLFTFKSDAIYVFDPDKASVVMWSNDISDIVDAQILKDTIYLWTGSGSMHAILFSPLEKFLVRLYLRKQYRLCAKLCEMHSKYLMKEAPSSSKLYLLSDLGTKLSNDEVTERILPLLQEISKCAQESQNAQRLESGIFVVENRHFLSTEDEPSLPELPRMKRAERLKDKSRSLSVSPERSRRHRRADGLRSSRTSHRSDSSSSLPELGKTQSKADCNSCDTNSGFGTQGTNSKESQHSSRMKRSFSKELFTSFETSPEAIQALKEIGQSVSSKITSGTKTLKERWQVLEGKILGSEVSQELLDIRPLEYVEEPSVDLHIGETKEDSEDIVYTNNQKDKSNGRSKFHPNLSVVAVTDVLSNLSNCNSSGGDHFDALTCRLFDNIMSMYDDYLNFCVNVSMRSAGDKGNASSMQYFLHEWAEKSFPFVDYFDEEVVKICAKMFHQCLSSKALVKWLQSLLPEARFNVKLGHLGLIYSLDAVKIDVLLSRVLVICSDLLDPPVILQCIQTSGALCYYVSFCTVLDKYQAGALQQVSIGKTVESSCWQWPLPLRLNAMYFMLRMDQIETCHVMGNNINVKDIYYLILRLHDEQSFESEAVKEIRFNSMFLSYLDRASDIESVMKSIFSDEHLLFFTVLAFESVNEGIGDSCKCGYPFPIIEDSRVQFGEIGRILSSHLWQTNHDRHGKLCENVPSMWKHMLSGTPGDNIESVLPLLLQLGDLSLLQQFLPHMTSTLWELALDMCLSLRAGQCLKCGLPSIPEKLRSVLPLSTLGALMVKSMGSYSALELLMKHPVTENSGDLDARFYQACIFSAIVEHHAPDLMSDVVDMVLKSTDTTSEIAVASSEVCKLLDESVSMDLGCKPGPVLGSGSSSDSRPHHWGVRLGLGLQAGNECPCCALPLHSQVLLQDSGLGLTVFRCGHAYHTVCLRQGPAAGCVLCTYAS